MLSRYYGKKESEGEFHKNKVRPAWGIIYDFVIRLLA